MASQRLSGETITSINFANSLNITTLEGNFHYRTQNNENSFFTVNSPLLSSIYHNKIHVLSNVRGDLIFADLCTNKFKVIQTDCGGIENLHIYNSSIICGGWNRHISLFNNQTSITTEHKIYHSDLKDHVFACTGEKTIWAYDLRNHEKPFYKENTNNIITCASLIDKDTYIIGSGDGKIKIDGLSNNETPRILFVGHKKEIEGKNHFYSVEKLLTINGRVFSCGDSRIIEWDLVNKKKRKIIYSGTGKVTQMCAVDDGIYFVEEHGESTNNAIHYVDIPL